MYFILCQVQRCNLHLSIEMNSNMHNHLHALMALGQNERRPESVKKIVKSFVYFRLILIDDGKFYCGFFFRTVKKCMDLIFRDFTEVFFYI